MGIFEMGFSNCADLGQKCETAWLVWYSTTKSQRVKWLNLLSSSCAIELLNKITTVSGMSHENKIIPCDKPRS